MRASLPRALSTPEQKPVYLFSKEKSSCFFQFLKNNGRDLTDNAQNCFAIREIDEQRIRDPFSGVSLPERDK